MEAAAGIKSKLPYLFSLLLGASVPFSMAPFDVWPIALIALTLWFRLMLNDRYSPGWHSFAFGTGLFAVGASWVYTSIHDFGLSSAPLASTLTGIFVLGLAALFCIPFILLNRLMDHQGHKRGAAFVFALAASYVLGEWTRSWLLTGFPWLYVGYSQINTVMAGWAPMGGVLLIDIALVVSAAALALASINIKQKSAAYWLLLAAAPWLAGAALSTIQWTERDGHPIKVAMVQANIPQELKWERHFLQTTIDRYLSLSEDLWDKNDWVIWPEAAIPLPFHRAQTVYDFVNARAKDSHTFFISGSLVRENGRYHNSAIALGQGEGVYHKRKLVPFGEYVPLEEWLRGTISFFNLPTSIIKPGPKNYSRLSNHLQPSMQVTPLICYEIVYPELARAKGDEHPVLITLSNDAWFGRSIGPLQHMQIAQMRALENQRYLLRATNTGVTAIVGPDGKMIKQAEQFVQTSLQGEIYKMTGSTPFAQMGNLLALLCCAIALVPLLLARFYSNRL
ncbi:apolipoprotein N-acyltransferase [Pseudoteredinibacter isoporae]|uniref:Apolipoprotein N-acyltransferase n=1 Tax=Pseudoteredinibacter isoporae TaxID=570281 RepID=A0A7X0MZ64_9GAMM|nr:apolipoprotein N-acyltransferase [Pseudoteredinibacter isoporae]MBB6522812.1 apolipoprotein N-acyltransferase [Pseudoteredinibacter isoporae]NHO88339.1 apolipoprotein N-acyltransferase [Pseudoteredinibacter isoporae]NIB23330.1 apolipoprotein N-acyltransferase [Pseudoteredinibacter isoporae]